MLDKDFEGDAMKAVRKSWSVLVDTDTKAKWQSMDKDARFTLYTDIDNLIKNTWVRKMKTYRENLESQGIVPFYDTTLSIRRFDEQHFVDTKALLEEAALEIMTNLLNGNNNETK